MHLASVRKGPLDTVQQGIHELFGFPLVPAHLFTQKMFLPSIDMWDDKENIHVEANIPGMEQKDISVRMKGDSLVLSACKEESKEEKKKNFYHSERYQGGFYRQMELPVSVDSSKIKASYKHGVLHVTLPKKKGAEGKEIKINVK